MRIWLCYALLLLNISYYHAQEEEPQEISACNGSGEAFDTICEFDDLPNTCQDMIPRPVFEKPSTLKVFFRKLGLRIFFACYSAKDWCTDKFQAAMQALMAMRYTL